MTVAARLRMEVARLRREEEAAAVEAAKAAEAVAAAAVAARAAEEVTAAAVAVNSAGLQVGPAAL